MTTDTPAIVEVIHPITGEKLLMREDFAAEGTWLPPCAKDIDAATLDQLRDELNVALFSRELVRAAHRSAAHKEAPLSLTA